jgi:hypothetical protein
MKQALIIWDAIITIASPHISVIGL